MNETTSHSSFGSAATEPTQDERSFAMLAHLLQFFGGFVPPLVIYLVKRNSRFVSFHALQALLWQAVYFLIVIFGMAAMFTGTITMLLHQPHNAPPNSAPPLGFFVGFGAFWLLFMMGMVANIIFSIVYSIKAYRGQWSAYPIVGRLARRIVDA
jgi:hypothetical protein